MTFPVHEDTLDNPELLDAADPRGMLLSIASSAAQLREATALAGMVDLSDITESGRPRAIVVAGVGASAMAGEILAGFAGVGAPLPIVAVRSHELPGWAGPTDLVIGVSSSGSSEETLAATAEALRRGCRLAGVGAGDSALEDAVVRGRGPFIAIPHGNRRGRANLWALTAPLLMLGEAARALPLNHDDIEAAAARLTEASHTFRPSSEAFVNPAKAFALQLAGSVPVIWGGSPVAALAARRWHAQLAENAKYPAVAGGPDASYSQLAVLDGPFASTAPQDIFADPEDDDGSLKLRLILLRDRDENSRLAMRMDIGRELAEERGIPVTEITAEGDGPLERLASLISYGDYVSTYLAIALGIDPTPIGAMQELKRRAARR